MVFITLQHSSTVAILLQAVHIMKLLLFFVPLFWLPNTLDCVNHLSNADVCVDQLSRLYFFILSFCKLLSNNSGIVAMYIYSTVLGWYSVVRCDQNLQNRDWLNL